MIHQAAPIARSGRFLFSAFLCGRGNVTSAHMGECVEVAANMNDENVVKCKNNLLMIVKLAKMLDIRCVP
jgi:hypothetical protein